ncbi:MAG TPA: hypothetical protein DEB40_10055, partial [Elusimicrobia bacterium]|nr:hypothetical protein [Elusimicrobiota bacterium]
MNLRARELPYSANAAAPAISSVGPFFFFCARVLSLVGAVKAAALAALIIALGAGRVWALTCNTTKTVGVDYTTINGAIGAIPLSMTGNYCIKINGGTYAEEVRVTSRTSNNWMIYISSAAGATVIINPPAGKTAALWISNTSVTVQGINIIPTSDLAATSYGVYVTSQQVTISSVNVIDPDSDIKTAGMYLNSWNTVSYSSVTVQAAHGFYLNGSSATTVSYSTAQVASASLYALYLNNAASNTFSVFTASNTAGRSGYILNSPSNHIAEGMFLGTGEAMRINGSSSNTITNSILIDKANTWAVVLTGNSKYNTVSQSTATSLPGSGTLYGMYTDSSSNTVTGCYIQGGGGFENNDADGTVIMDSVLVAHNTSQSGFITRNGVNATLTANTVYGGSQSGGITIDSSNSGMIRVSTNTIMPSAKYGFYISAQASGAQIWITSNTILPPVTTANQVFGIYMNGLVTGATIQNNGIYYRIPGSMGGFETEGIVAWNSQGLLIRNNRLNNPGMVTNANFYGAYFNGSSKIDFQFNDFHSTGTGLNNAFLLAFDNSTMTVKNNIFLSSFSASLTANLYMNAASGIDSDYNDWFSSNTLTFTWGKTYTGLASWQATGKDANSISSHPLWKDTSAGVEDFHPLSTGGRYHPDTGLFTPVDRVDSPTIDMADPAWSVTGIEPAPNGNRA